MNLAEFIRQVSPIEQTVKSSMWISKHLFIWYYPKNKYEFNLSIPPDFSGYKYEINIYENGVSLGREYSDIIQYCLTEEEYFQASLIHNFGDFDLECFKACKYIYDETLAKVELK